MASNLKHDPYSVHRNEDSGAPADGDRYSQIAGEMQHQIQDKPVSSVAIAVGVGIGAGLLLSSLLSSERTQRDRFARRMGSYFPSGNELRSSIQNMLPDSISSRLN